MTYAKFPYIFVVALLLVTALPYHADAQNQTRCTLSATADVYVAVHDFSQDRKGETIWWSGDIRRGGEVSVNAIDGKILIEWKDLTEDNPRTQNRSETCDGNTILVP